MVTIAVLLHESMSRLCAEEPEDRGTDITAHRTSRFSTSDLRTDASICGISCSADWGINKLLNPLIIGNNLLLRLKGLDIRPIKLYGVRHVLASVARTG